MPAPRLVLLMGASASGKTAVGRALADALGWAFEDADAYHSDAARATMARGEGLTDADREPWLARLRALIDERVGDGPPTVLACSALKASHRQTLGADRSAVAAFWLDVPASELADRLGARESHFAGPALLPSQLAAAEPPATGRLDGTAPVAEIVREIRERL